MRFMKLLALALALASVQSQTELNFELFGHLAEGDKIATHRYFKVASSNNAKFNKLLGDQHLLISVTSSRNLGFVSPCNLCVAMQHEKPRCSTAACTPDQKYLQDYVFSILFANPITAQKLYERAFTKKFRIGCRHVGILTLDPQEQIQE